MYESHWKLTTRPFEPRFSSDFYYPSESHQASLLKLRYAIENRRSVSVLGGVSGIGKSFVLQQLRQQLPEKTGPVIQVSYPAISSDELLLYLARQFAPNSVPSIVSPSTAIEALEMTLRKNIQEDRHALLLIDEAEWLESNGSLEVLRLLLNLGIQDANCESALTVILSGQPIVIGQLERYPALDQRVAVRCLLETFDVAETNAYIGHRIRQANGQIDRIFDTEALDAIHHFSHGIPRKINALCDLALMVGYAQDLTLIQASLVDNVQRELAPAA
jgi:general secretion pathway protein A